MENSKKIKLYIGLFYIILVGLFLFLIFSNFTIQELTSYEFIKNYKYYFFELKKSNMFLLSIFFILFSIIWVLAGGFASPLGLFSGFIFGKFLGTILLLIGMSIGATGLYLFANFFLKNLIREKFLNRFETLENKFKKSEFIYLLIYRFVGGIPWAISCVLPCIFNVKASNFFWATLIGIVPQIFIVVSIGSGLEKIIDQNLEAPGILQLATSPEIYIPLLAFLILLIFTIFMRKIFYKK